MKEVIEDGEVEQEINDESAVIEIPFNPNDIKISAPHLNLGDLIDRLAHGELRLNSDFQRRADLWNDEKKSRLIESVLLRLPLPTFYFDATDDNKWEVIDGLQRISTLRSFVINKTLRLEKLQFLTAYKGKLFDELPRDLQRRITTFPINVYLVDKGTPAEVKFILFSRLNQGGLILTAQELRNALHQGAPAKLIKDLVRGSDITGDDGQIAKATKEGMLFVKVTEGRIKTERMEDCDFATRFVSFYLIGYENYTPDMDTFMNKGMMRINELNADGIATLKLAYCNALETAYAIFDNDAFRKRMNDQHPRKPINKALFETLMVNFAQIEVSELQKLISRKDLFKQKLMGLYANNDRFLNAITQGTAQKTNVTQRFLDIKKIINETLRND